MGYRIVPVNPRRGEILGEPVYARLEDIPGPVDVAVVFRAPEHAPEVARSAVAKGVRVLWLQEGVVSEEAAAVAAGAGLDVVMNRCIYKETQRRRGHMATVRPARTAGAIHRLRSEEHTSELQPREKLVCLLL